MGTITTRHYYETPIPAPEPEPLKEKKARIARINAAKSTGPKTAEGKAKSSQNARKHGLTAQVLLINAADKKAYEELRLGYADSLQPQNLAEEDLVECIAETAWKIRMARNIETDALRDNLEQGQTIHEAFTFDADSILKISAYQSRLHRQWHKLFDQLRKLQKDASEPNKHGMTLRPYQRPVSSPWVLPPVGAARTPQERGHLPEYELFQKLAAAEEPPEPILRTPSNQAPVPNDENLKNEPTHLSPQSPENEPISDHPADQERKTPAENDPDRSHRREAPLTREEGPPATRNRGRRHEPGPNSSNDRITVKRRRTGARRTSRSAG